MERHSSWGLPPINFMFEDTDPLLEAVAALKATGVDIVPIGEELDRWQICDFIRSVANVWRLTASRGLVESNGSR